MVQHGGGRRRRSRKVLEPEAFGFVTMGGVEWKRAWRQLVDLTGDVDRMARDPESGEVWQYLCSFLREGQWLHEFRHRWHPRTRDRWVVHLPATAEWSPQAETPELQSPTSRELSFHSRSRTASSV